MGAVRLIYRNLLLTKAYISERIVIVALILDSAGSLSMVRATHIEIGLQLENLAAGLSTVSPISVLVPVESLQT